MLGNSACLRRVCVCPPFDEKLLSLGPGQDVRCLLPDTEHTSTLWTNGEARLTKRWRQSMPIVASVVGWVFNLEGG